MIETKPVEFADRDIRLISLSLPDTVNARRRELLPQILREWGRYDALRDKVWEVPHEVERKRRARFSKIGKAARNLLQMVAYLDLADCLELEVRIAKIEGVSFEVGDFSFTPMHRLKTAQNVISTLAAAADTPILKPSRGQPRKTTSRLVIWDLASLYEYFTYSRAERIVARSSGGETGPFYAFAAAIWPVVFGNGDDGLPAAIKAWASHRKSGAESPIVSVIAARRPEWGLFD